MDEPNSLAPSIPSLMESTEVSGESGGLSKAKCLVQGPTIPSAKQYCSTAVSYWKVSPGQLCRTVATVAGHTWLMSHMIMIRSK